MRAPLCWLGLLGAILVAGCATPAKPPVQDSSVAVLPATEEQLLLGKHRAAAIYERWSEEEKAKFVKRAAPYLAVRTLNLTPEQAATLGSKIPSPETAVCVVIWDAKAETVVGTECYVAVTPPAKGLPARFGLHTAQYVGSF